MTRLSRLGLLIGVLVLVGLAAVPALAFPDVASTDPYAQAINGLSGLGVINGGADGRFHPEALVTRQQFAKMVVLTLGLPVSDSVTCPFTDVQVGGYASDPLFPDKYIAVCASSGITTGKTATIFAPYANVTRAQVMTMVVRAASAGGVALSTPDSSYYSNPQSMMLTFDDPKHGGYAKQAECNGLLAGIQKDTGGTWEPGLPATRGEVAQILWTLKQKIGSTPGTGASPPTQTKVAGGVVRHITNSGPQNVGFWPEMGPVDEGAVFPSVERICEYRNRELVPLLAKSFTENPQALAMTCELNQGIKFHDGSELTADVAVWNYQMGIDAGKLRYADAIDSVEATGKYTFVIHLKRWDNQLIHSFGWVPMYSKDAFVNGGTDEDSREAWALDHCVGTGPFILQRFVRDQSISFVKNPNYWQSGQPYLDGIDVEIVPDAAIAKRIMEAGQADTWQNADPVSRSQLTKKGFADQTAWAGFLYHLMPNTVDGISPCSKLKVREAIEYAVNKEELTATLGHGIDQALYAVEPPAEWGGNAITVKRTYDPTKARQLLAEAGYPDGCNLSLLAIEETGGGNEYAEAIKRYLDAAGFVTFLDIADPGRFYGSVFGTGWNDLALMFSGTDPDALISCNAWWSSNTASNLVSFKRPPEFARMFAEANAATDKATQIQKTSAIVRLMNEQALMIPLYFEPAGLIVAGYVHTEYPAEGFVRWDWANFWMDKH
jgi:peptide/nickel transport system substrate-binding protein